MPISARYPQGRSQDFTFPRRNFLRGLAVALLPSLIHPQPLTHLGHCRPKFCIGNKVCTSWVDETTGEFRSEQGEILGLCWHPKEQQWEYLVLWRNKIFDEQLTSAINLEFNHG